MFQLLDMRTVLLLGALTCLLLVGIMVYFSLARKTYPGFHCWTVGMVSAGVGSVLLTLRGILPNSITIPLANTLLAVMPFMLTRGLESFAGHKWKRPLIDLAIFSVFIAIFIWATFFSPNIFFRVLCLSLVMMLYFLNALYVSVRLLPSVLGEQNVLLNFMISFSALSMLVRIVSALEKREALAFLINPGAAQVAAVVMTVLGVTGIVCALVILNTHRMEKDLKEANRIIADTANKDALTALYNRRYFDAALEKEFSRIQRYRQPLSLIMADIDCFKDYNDAYGHQAGDECLRAIADILKKAGGRASDTAARYGGEEFVIILPDTDAYGARIISESILDFVRGMALKHEFSAVAGIVTLSLGVTTVVPDESMCPEMLVELADKALYESKRNGRNQVCVFEGDLPG